MALNTASQGDFMTNTISQANILIDNLAASSKSSSQDYVQVVEEIKPKSDFSEIFELKSLVVQLLKSQQGNGDICENVVASSIKDHKDLIGESSSKHQEGVNYVGEFGNINENRNHNGFNHGNPKPSIGDPLLDQDHVAMTPIGRNLEAMMHLFMENQQQVLEGMKQCAKDNKDLGFKLDSIRIQETSQCSPGKVEENPKFCKVITTKKNDAISPAPRVQSTSKNHVTRREDDEPISKAPHQRRLKKREDPVNFIFPCTINGIDFIESLCDTGSTVNLMSKIIARKLGIVEMEPPGKMLKFADASSTTPCGFVRDLEMQVGGCLVPTDFHIIEDAR
ncbi:unnamed protein product [Microthlaspi erraticum]|uniref:Aspartic peptidase DDI1-type domain-containing protein n=1 Tax=Microthlaspi erraticum TaxID=1685480 RepID=A0A6D2JTY6_9BRAS|nr:unnamed protein product [Microthlaspi erraticum]